VLGALAACPVAIVAASPAGEANPRASASARLTVVAPAPSVRRALAAGCRAEGEIGYVPVVTVPAGTTGVPPDGRFVRCASGDTVFLVPDAR
jgi:hypothetical protein